MSFLVDTVDISWPLDEEVPIPLVEYDGAPSHAIVASGLDSANPERRLRYVGQAAADVVFTWVFSIPQYDAWKTFFLDTLYNGAAAFKIDIRYPLNSDLTKWVCKIASDPEAEYLDGAWQVKMNVDLLYKAELDPPAAIADESGFLVLPDSAPFTVLTSRPFYVHNP